MDFTGMIFSYTSKSRGTMTRWMITDKPYQDLLSSSSPATKCSKSGKLFKSYNGFSNRFLQELANLSRLETASNVFLLERAPGSYDIVKANIELSSKITKAKNRIQYLKGCISTYTKELAQLEADLENPK